jgi:CRISPR-associated protein Cmr6
LDKVDISERHPGLQLNKLSSVGDMEVQQDALKKVVSSYRAEPLLDSLFTRRATTLDALDAQRLLMATRGSLTLHLSRLGALENAGIALHPVYGFVYLPGSGIKGLVRAYAETVWAPDQADSETAWRQIEKAFGWSPGSERHKRGWRPNSVEAQEGAVAGRLVFHDAWPTRWPSLIVDVVNNHHPGYYDGKDDPGDWEDPIPVYFLAVGPGNRFDFAISDRKHGDSELLKLACGWLRDALTIEGAGAKTAAGYGRFKPVEEELASIPKTLTNATYKLRLASPAFLAGANQKQEDCDLRPATLRGLLRWWWRTMHAGHLDCKTLKQLETAVWGDAESGSPVRIAVDFVKGGQPEKYNKNDMQFQNLPRPERGQKVTQGLFYVSYGMAEDKDRNRWRWFRPAGSCWRVTLTARNGRFQDVRLQSDVLIEQASAALWLLTQFGGVGSRSRKGFGSFDDIEVEGIGSTEACIASAKRFRELCKLDEQQGQIAKAPALEEALKLKLIMEQDTVWADPWYALDQTGMVLQLFTKDLDAEKRVALGLPRRVGRGRDALHAQKGDRHASPALWSLTTRQDGQLTVRLIAFPAACLPDKAESKETLQKLKEFARLQLRQQAEQTSRPTGQTDGRRGGRPARQRDTAMGAAFKTALVSKAQSLPKANDRVQAELLEEKTRRGGWKAKHLDSGLQGPIQNTRDVPADAEPGQHVELTVAYVRSPEMAFKWS